MIYLKIINIFVYLLILTVFLTYIQIKQNKIILNILLNLLIAGIYFSINDNLITTFIYISTINIFKRVWILNNKELLKIEKPLQNLEDKTILESKNIIKLLKQYYFNKKVSLNLLLIGLLIFSIQLSDIIGTFHLKSQDIFIKNLIFTMSLTLISIYFGLKAEKVLKNIEIRTIKL